MYYPDSPAGGGPVIAVIGGGASGTLAVIHLLREAAGRPGPLRIVLIDRHDRHGRGQAYATAHPAHLLNSPAGMMSAVAGDPGHFTRWARQAGLPADGFLPRSTYGRYLSGLLAETERNARPGVRVSHLGSEVVAIHRTGAGHPLRLHLAADGRIDADLVVLATGNLPPAPPCPVSPLARYIPDPWEPRALAPAADGSLVVLAGTGLTMLDVAIALTSAHPRTTVCAVSRHALLPRQHRWPPAVARPGVSWAAPAPVTPLRLTGLIREVRSRVARSPDDWQDVVDALRPQVPSLWEQLTPADRRLFLCHVARYWEVHRHRVPPATGTRIAALQAAGRLRVLPGRIAGVSGDREEVRVRIAGGAAGTEITGGWLVNCTGPGADITASAVPLLRSLLSSGLARPDPLRLGLDADARGAVRDAAGQPAADIFTLGPLLRGRWYETTAVPEIRDQAARLAHSLYGTLTQAGRDSAA